MGLNHYHVDVFTRKPLSGNGVTVFRLREALPTAVMQELMRQFESIFVLKEAKSQIVRAWVFTMEEELDFAGHPVLGAAAALHEETIAGVREVSWTFQLNKKSFPVQTVRQNSEDTGATQAAVNFLSSMKEAQRASEMVIYPGADHGYAQPLFNAGKNYNPEAIRTTWVLVENFLDAALLRGVQHLKRNSEVDH